MEKILKKDKTLIVIQIDFLAIPRETQQQKIVTNKKHLFPWVNKNRNRNINTRI